MMNFGQRLGRASSLLALSVTLVAALSSGGAFAGNNTDEMRPASRMNYDALAARAARRDANVARAQVDPLLVRSDAPIRLQEALGVPTFLWAAPASAASAAGGAGRLANAVAGPAGPEQVARAILSRFAPAYGLDDAAAARAVLREIHATGRGGVIARFGQEAQGIEVFRNEIKVLMSKNLEAVALAGYLTAQTPTGVFTLTPQQAIATAARDYAGAPVDAGLFRDTGRVQGAYTYFETAAGAAIAAGIRLPEPTRVKPVWFDLPDGLVPSFYLELEIARGDTRSNDMYSYVISAVDGTLLFRNNLTADASASYRVWAETSPPNRPFDGPQGTDTTPHLLPDEFQPAAYPAPSLAALNNGPISTGDPWLPAGATETIGNNVEAYVDLFSPDGFSAGDFHATVTSPRVFDYTHDLTLAPNFVPPSGSRAQQMAVITQLFYNLNFFHDFYYDSGFNETAGNAQTSNYGRGGIEGDSIKAEAQDFSGRDNANMATPADGGRPRMQMYLFDPLSANKINIASTPPPLAVGDITLVNTAAFGPTTFTVTADIVYASPPDGCGGNNTSGPTAIVNAVAGKIVFIDRGGSCARGFAQKAENAQLAGASGVIIGNIASSASANFPPGMGGTPNFTITIGVLSVAFADGQNFRASFAAGTVHGTIQRLAQGVDRDGSLDNQIQAHEWGHYISNRLVGNANGLTTNLSGGLGEGWADFHAMLLTVRAEDSAVTGNDQWQAPYALGGYATPAFSIPPNNYYFGIRRYPYSTDLLKNPLTYKHIADNNPIPGQAPAGPPRNDVIALNGAPNSEVHDTGEVWANMLWECYAALLRDVTNNTSGRNLTFAQAQQKMKDILVAAYKMTPNDPTLLEARDAVLAAAFADDAVDYALFATAFAKRGAGANAVSPSRYSPTNVGVVEDLVPPIGLALAATPAVGDDVVATCGGDGVLQMNETGTMTIVLNNLVAGTAPATSGTLASTTNGVVVNTPSLSFPAAASGGTTSASTTISLTGAAVGTRFDFTLTLTNTLGAAPVVIPFAIRANYNVAAATTDDVESPHTAWTVPITTISPTWRRVEVGPVAHRWFGPDDGTPTDISLQSPVLQVGAGPFSFTFEHRWQFEFDPAGAFFDGGVIEISTNNGLTWADVGAANIVTLSLHGYFGAFASGSGSVAVNLPLANGGFNPLQGRPAFGGISALYPSPLTTTVSLGTAFSNRAVRVRFRIGTDISGAAPGWEIDTIQFTGLVNAPFDVLVASSGVCPAAVTPPTALAGPNQSVLQNSPVTLDGTGSTTPNPGPLTFTWVQIAGPSVALNTPTSPQPTFTAPLVTPVSTTAATSVVLTFMLTVNDGTATSAPSFVNVTVTNPNRVPVANAGAPQTVTAGTLVTLNGSATDPDLGTVFTWAWTQTGGPAVTLSSNTAQKPTFTAPVVAASTIFTFQLVANDGQVNSAPATTTVTVNRVAGATALTTLTPCRVLDTRNADGALGGPALQADEVRTFPVSTAICGIPPTAAAIAVNFTVTASTAAGTLSAGPGNLPLNTTSVISFAAGQTRANNGFLRLATDGSGNIVVANNSTGTVHFILDVVGYFQ